MTKRLFKLFCAILTLILLISSTTGAVFAQTKGITSKTIEPFSCQSETCLFNANDINPQDYDTDLMEIAEDLRETMTARQPSIMLRFVTETEYKDEVLKQFISGLFEEAFSETDKANQGDYLRYIYAGYAVGDGSIYISDGKNYYYTINLNISYYTTAAQERLFDEKIEEVIRDFGFNSRTTPKQKSDRIYEYITRNVKYDYENLNDESYKLKYSAFAALINGKAVCQGYASLYYRLAKECGLEVRVITGTSYNQGHAWNIVKIDGLYFYYLDSTWDAGEWRYNYYLKGSEAFTNHNSDEEFKTAEFQMRYPISQTDFAGHSYSVLREESFETVYICKFCLEVEKVSKLSDGKILAKGDDGKWYYFVDRQKSNDRTLVKKDNIWFFVENGTWNKTAETVVKYNGVWFYVKNGRWDTKGNTLVKYGANWLYIKNGRWDNTARTLTKYKNVWFFVEKGVWDTTARTLVKMDNVWFFVDNGRWNTTAETVVKYNGTWFYVKNGRWDTKGNTLVKYNGKWLYIKNGRWANTANTYFTFKGVKFKIKNGVAQV